MSAAIESPCIKVCVIDPAARICTGCHRTLDEIAAWSRMTPEARRSVMTELPARAHRLGRPAEGRREGT